MTDAEIKSLADEYKRLEHLIEIEQNKQNQSTADVRYYEDQMARIETEFQQADVDISLWI